MMKHEENCGCVTCAKLRQVSAQEHRAMEMHGWYAHAVDGGDPQSPTGFNYHTHGFEETLGHLNVQIVLPMRKSPRHSIAKIIFERIRAGATFSSGDRAGGIVPNFDVAFIRVREGNRDVLRVILPGKNGGTEPSMLSDEEPEFSLQWNAV